MPYIDRSLGKGEAVIARAQFHWLYNLSAWTQLLIPAVLLAGLLSWDSQHPDFLGTDNPLTWTTALVALWFVLGLISFLRLMIRKWTTEIGITTHRFIMKTGLFTLHTQEMAIHNIEGVKVDQGFWGRVLGYGHIRMEGTGVDATELPPIADPIAFRAAIETAKGDH